MVFGLISHGYCGQETNHRMFAFFNFFFTPFAWHNSLQDTTLYNTPSLSYIYSFWPNSMHAVSTEHKTQFFNPSQWQPWEFSNKKKLSFLLQWGIPLDEAEIVLVLTASQFHSEFWNGLTIFDSPVAILLWLARE